MTLTQHLVVFLVVIIGSALCIQNDENAEINTSDEALSKLLRLSLMRNSESFDKRALPRMGRSYSIEDDSDENYLDAEELANIYIKRGLPRMGRALPRMGRALPRMGRALPRMGRALPRMG